MEGVTLEVRYLRMTLKICVSFKEQIRTILKVVEVTVLLLSEARKLLGSSFLTQYVPL